MRNKYQIYGKQEEQEREPVRLRLVDGVEDVIIKAVDKDGEFLSYLVGFNQETGKICRYSSVDARLGLPLDSQRRVLLEEDD